MLRLEDISRQIASAKVSVGETRLATSPLSALKTKETGQDGKCPWTGPVAKSSSQKVSLKDSSVGREAVGERGP